MATKPSVEEAVNGVISLSSIVDDATLVIPAPVNPSPGDTVEGFVAGESLGTVALHPVNETKQKIPRRILLKSVGSGPVPFSYTSYSGDGNSDPSDEALYAIIH